MWKIINPEIYFVEINNLLFIRKKKIDYSIYICKTKLRFRGKTDN